MKIIFVNEELRRFVVEGTTTKKVYAKYLKDERFMSKLRFQIDLISVATSFSQLYDISPLHYEKLKYSRSGLTSFRIMKNRVERVICREENDTVSLLILQIDESHYGNKK